MSTRWCCYVDGCGRTDTALAMVMNLTTPLCARHWWVADGDPWAQASTGAREQAHEAATAAGVPGAVTLAEASLNHGTAVMALVALDIAGVAENDPTFPRPVVTVDDVGLWDPDELRRWDRWDAARLIAAGDALLMGHP